MTTERAKRSYKGYSSFKDKKNKYFRRDFFGVAIFAESLLMTDGFHRARNVTNDSYRNVNMWHKLRFGLGSVIRVGWKVEFGEDSGVFARAHKVKRGTFFNQGLVKTPVHLPLFPFPSPMLCQGILLSLASCPTCPSTPYTSALLPFPQ